MDPVAYHGFMLAAQSAFLAAVVALWRKLGALQTAERRCVAKLAEVQTELRLLRLESDARHTENIQNIRAVGKLIEPRDP